MSELYADGQENFVSVEADRDLKIFYKPSGHALCYNRRAE